jgi:hypothetical protein
MSQILQALDGKNTSYAVSLQYLTLLFQEGSIICLRLRTLSLSLAPGWYNTSDYRMMDLFVGVCAHHLISHQAGTINVQCVRLSRSSPNLREASGKGSVMQVMHVLKHQSWIKYLGEGFLSTKKGSCLPIRDFGEALWW